MSEPSTARTPTVAAIATPVGNMVGIKPGISAKFGVLLTPIVVDYGWARALVSGALGIASLISTVIYPLAGRGMDKYGSRHILPLADTEHDRPAVGIPA